MGQVLYRKYRSRSLSEIVGQEHITKTLAHALETGKISHAYLLTGPRGTGKTSIARIMAHALNGLEYSEDPHFDIIEIDAASNNGVEDVRDLREKVQSAPTSAKYKVYIIDEVHMLSKAAFNALLKTLEEPPAHVIFILATTEVHKLPETIISRTQRYALRPVPLEKVVNHLKTIAKSEKIDIDDEALAMIAEHGDGSFRDSISLLDQARSQEGKITKSSIENILGRAPAEIIDDIISYVDSKESTKVAGKLQEMYDQGYEASMIAAQLSRQLRTRLAETSDYARTQAQLELLKQLIDVAGSPKPSQLLELVLLSHALPPASTQSQPKHEITPEKSQVKSTEEKTSSQVKSDKVDDTAKPLLNPETEEELATPATGADTSVSVAGKSSPDQETVPTGELTPETEDLWQEVLQVIKQTHNTLYGIARMAKPYLESDILTLETKFPFHQKRLNETKNRNILVKCVSEVRGQSTNVTCVVSQTTTNNAKNESISKDISTISNIFGGAELL